MRDLEYDLGGEYCEIDCTIQAAKRLMGLKVHLGGVTHVKFLRVKKCRGLCERITYVKLMIQLI